MAVVAIWSNAQDPTTRLLLAAVEEAGHEVIEVTTGPEESDPIGVRLDESGVAEVTIADQDIRRLSTVFFRKPVPPEYKYEESQARFLAREVMQGLESALSLTGAKWVNHPGANRTAADKLGNLAMAIRLGLCVPRTWAGSAIPTRHPRSLVGKPVSHGLMSRRDGAAMVFATRMPEDFTPTTDLEPSVPMLVQEEVPADADVRATIVGKQVLTAERLRTEGELDWRSSEDSGGWHLATLPEGVQGSLVELVRIRNLSFGACDLLRRGDEYVFLELNPNGQWGWLELEAGLPISHALASLVGGSA